MERLVEENTKLSQQLAHAKNKGDAAKARVRVLENEQEKLRSQMKILVDKVDTDDQLIDALKMELAQLQQSASSRKEEKVSHLKKQITKTL